jgi:hypothetical protein
VCRRERWSSYRLGENGRGSSGLSERVGLKGQNELLGRVAMDFSTGEGGRMMGVRVGMRR